jgi:hypothetical protein
VSLVLGAAHVASVPTVFSIANPVGLSVHLAGIPNYVPRDIGSPAEYHRLARLNLGNSLGYKPHLQLVTTPQLIYPLEPEYTLLSVNMTAGVTVTIDEIASSTTLIPKAAPYDRNPADWTRALSGSFIGPTSPTSPWSYTVPAGRKLWLSTATVQISRIIAASAIGGASASMARNGVNLVNVENWSNTPGVWQQNSVIGAPLVLVAGETLSAQYSNPDTGGYIHASCNATGFLFDS